VIKWHKGEKDPFAKHQPILPIFWNSKAEIDGHTTVAIPFGIKCFPTEKSTGKFSINCQINFLQGLIRESKLDHTSPCKKAETNFRAYCYKSLKINLY